MKTIAIINMKGGCAKTTTSVNMGYILAEDYDKKVLIIDNDKQPGSAKTCKRPEPIPKPKALFEFPHLGSMDAKGRRNRSNDRRLFGMGQQQGKTEIKIHREIITKLRWLPIRGSAFNNTSNSGPSALNLNNPRSNSNDNIGFRSALPLCQEALRLRPQGQYKQG